MEVEYITIPLVVFDGLYKEIMRLTNQVIELSWQMGNGHTIKEREVK